MKKSLRQKRAFVKRGYKSLIDPRARIIGAFDLIEGCSKGGMLEGGTAEMDAVKYAILFALLPHILKLIGMNFWNELQMPKGNTFSTGPDCMDETFEKVASVGDEARQQVVRVRELSWAPKGQVFGRQPRTGRTGTPAARSKTHLG